MNRIKLSSKFIYYGLFVISIILIWLIYGKSCLYVSFAEETLSQVVMPQVEFQSNKILHIFASSDHNWFLVSLLQNLFAKILPYYLKIHPQVFLQKYVSIFMFFVTVVFIYSLAWNCSCYSKNLKRLPFLTLLILPFITILFIKSGFFWVFQNECWFYCYILNSIWWILLYGLTDFIYCKSIFPLDDDKEKFNISKQFAVFFFILLFFVGIGHEVAKLTYISALFICFLLHYFFISKKINYKKVIPIFSIIVFVNTFLFFSTVFKNWFHCNTQEITDANNVNELKLVLTSFYNGVFLDNLLKLIVIILLCVLIFYCTTDTYKKKKIIISQISIIISLYIVNLCCIFCSGAIKDICLHPGLKFLTDLIFLRSILLMFGYLFWHSEEKYKIITYTIFACLYGFVINFILQNQFQIEYSQREGKIEIQNKYINEKIYLLNKKLNKKTNYLYPRHKALYINYWYNNNQSTSFYSMCNYNDKIKVCQDKMLTISKVNLNYTFTQEELENPDFQQFVKYWNQKDVWSYVFEDNNKIKRK